MLSRTIWFIDVKESLGICCLPSILSQPTVTTHIPVPHRQLEEATTWSCLAVTNNTTYIQSKLPACTLERWILKIPIQTLPQVLKLILRFAGLHLFPAKIAWTTGIPGYGHNPQRYIRIHRPAVICLLFLGGGGVGNDCIPTPRQ